MYLLCRQEDSIYTVNPQIFISFTDKVAFNKSFIEYGYF